MLRMSLVLALGLLVAALGRPRGTLDREIPVQDKQVKMLSTIASSNTNFASQLYKLLVLKNPGKNIIFSPLSIFTDLAFLGLGAQGTTLAEILKGLNFGLPESCVAEIHQGFQHLLHTLNQPSDQLQLSMGNAMFIQEQLEVLGAFLEDAHTLYEAQIVPTNFQQPADAEQLINDFVRNETQGRIVELVRNLDPRTAMILVNYIFLKAKWETPFDPRDTFESKFYLSKTRSVQVPMMTAEDLTVPYFRDKELSCTVVELKYTGNASALFILPDQGKMQKVEAKLLPETLGKWKKNLKPKDIDELSLPKFSISDSYELKDILSQLGIREIFSRKANLSGITTCHELQVTKVMHNALLDVKEEGTEAAAATGFKLVPMSAKLNPIILRLDRPFLIYIFHKDIILFMAKVANPNQAQSS
ncbi:serine protease inhibitor A3N-like [Dipodomys merriami]|uniref:serine protease inhibitor A3N-like n=1 Tax=Dipodomys merriami TaxID=94247 RepID=UPI003855CB79